MKILRTAIFAFAVMGLAAACGGKDKGAAAPEATPTTEPAPAEGTPAEGTPAEGTPAEPTEGAPQQ